MPASAWDRKHLLGLEGLSAGDLDELLSRAERLLPVAGGRQPRLDDLAGRTIANLFFEDSTRTRCSFTLAARRLGADTLDLTSAGSSLNKGETLIDTARNIQAMGVGAMIVRCSASGGAHMIARALDAGTPVINAGDGRHEHPTQGLLDLLTLRQRLGDLKGRTVGIVGDIANSRVARSACHGLTTLGANVILCGPPALAPKSFEQIVAGPGQVRGTYDLDAILPTLDAIMMLRVQFERAESTPMHSSRPDAPVINAPAAACHEPQAATSPRHQSPSLVPGDYRERYGLTACRAARLPKHAPVLHPGPLNRGLEIDSDVADAAPPRGRSAILQQVANGVAVRMAVLQLLMSK